MRENTTRAGIALGSNLGDRLANLRAAIGLLEAMAVPGSPFLKASIYQTEPVHCPPDSPVFYNTVVEISFQGGATDLLELTQAAENQLGRARNPVRNAPRVIDIDLLYFGPARLDTGSLVLPHPRLQERRFVLEPLAEIRADFVLPGHHRSVGELLAGLDSSEPPLVRIPED